MANNLGLPPLPDRHTPQPRQPAPADSVDLAGFQRGTLATISQAAAAATAKVEAHIQPRLAANAAELTRLAFYTATADLLVVALRQLVAACYQTAGKMPIGMEPDGRVNVVVPWSKASHKMYGLRRHQADLLALVMRAWIVQYENGQYARAPVFVDRRRRWYVNLADYPTAASAAAAFDGWITAGYVRAVELSIKV
jgi:hypothetical protein